MLCYLQKIGEISGNNYYFNVPYKTTEEFIEYIGKKPDDFGSMFFGIDRTSMVENLYAVSFHVTRIHTSPEKEYYIHYHMFSKKNYSETYNPVLEDSEGDMEFSSIDEIKSFLIKFIEDKKLTEVCTELIENEIDSACKVIERQRAIIKRFKKAKSYL
jgi:hypothetical protein